MSQDLVLLPDDMPLREAAQQLMRNQVSGAPVVDAVGKCVGVLSAFDFLRMPGMAKELGGPDSPPLPLTCSYQSEVHGPDGETETGCTLPRGVCPVQVVHKGPHGEETIICSQPHSVLADWQVVNVEELPTGEVRRYMTADPVTVRPATTIRTLARMMIDAHIHRIIVVDKDHVPIGIVSATDILSALAYSDAG
jgi:CBS domain-containing protein